MRLTAMGMLVVATLSTGSQAADLWVTYPGGSGPGKGKHIVLISGDEEYHSEECLPQLAQILSRHQGFKCTVLFAIDPKDGTINPDIQNNIPGLEALRTADLLIIATRFRDLPDEQMKHIVDYVESGRPILGLRTATHAFKIDPAKTYALQLGQQGRWLGRGLRAARLGETWIDHHGQHGKQSTRGVIAAGTEKHPIVQGCSDIWGPTDVYKVRLPLPGDSKPLILGQVLEGMKPADKPVTGAQNDPMMPVAWTRTYEGGTGKTGRVFTTTMGAATDLANEGVRRLLVNGVFWCLSQEDRISAKLEVGLVGKYQPTAFGFKGYQKGLKPSHYQPAR